MTQNVLQRMPPDSRVAVIRLRSLGDCVLTTPALSLLKEFRPDLRIGVVVEDRFAPVFQGNPDIDFLLAPTVAAIARWKPELTVNLHGGGGSSQMTFASRARWRAGFEHFRFRALYNVQIPRAQFILGVSRKVHTAEHLASAMFFLGVPTREIPRAKLFAEKRGWTSVTHLRRAAYAVLHPKASAPDKTWGPEKFRVLGGHLRRELGLEPIFIAGPGECLDEFDGFECVLGATLVALKALLSGAALFVGNDSGPAHMAAALGLPVVALFGSSDPEIWGPWKTDSEVLTDPAGIRAISAARVAGAVTRLYAGQAR